MDADALNVELAGMDIYLLDQVLKGRFKQGSRIVDVGCGGGRNLAWFARNGFEVYGIDSHEGAVSKLIAANLAPVGNIVHGSAAALPWPDSHFQGVICNALLHLLGTRDEFNAVLRETWRVLTPGGVWFARLATTLSMEQHAKPLGDGRYRMPGTQWDILPTSLEDMLRLTADLSATLLEPIKTVNVQNTRAMATWVMQK
ncbi:MAG: class I SAM-dependent methyltransferase [Planctomycetes bacterium]|nr:class I SAM-dependent methyltransferase [Planctomycetota bacterium]